MERHVAFLRGINLGKRRVKNPELAAVFERLGLAEVGTFRASGNVVFAADSGEKQPALRERIETGLHEGLGFEVAVHLRSLDEVAAIAAREPFPASALAASKGKLQVVLLRAEPKAAGRRAALALSSERDLLAVEGAELYWLPSGGVSESELDLRAVEAALGPGTQRTMGTIEQIAAKYG